MCGPKGDRVCPVWLKFSWGLDLCLPLSHQHPIRQFNGFWSDLDQDPKRSYHSRKKMLPLPLLPPVKHQDWSRCWGRPSCSSVVFLLDATRETKENMIENLEFQCVGEHRRGTGTGAVKPFPSRSDPSICMLDRSGSDPSIWEKAGKDWDLNSISIKAGKDRDLNSISIKASKDRDLNSISCMLGIPCLLYRTYLTVRVRNY